MAHLPSWPGGPARDERPDRPFTGYKLAHATVSADGARTGFAGLTLGAASVYSVVSDATCVWNRRHAPPRRWCGCGFYCLHALADARSLACATENRSAVLLEVAASGRYIRYERGLRYGRQRVRAVLDARCGCGRPGTLLADAGSGLVGWRHLAPACAVCIGDRPALTMAEFAARLGGPVSIAPPLRGGPATASRATAGTTAAGATLGPGASGFSSAAEESPIAVLTAEIALLHARLDDLQSRMGR